MEKDTADLAERSLLDVIVSRTRGVKVVGGEWKKLFGRHYAVVSQSFGSLVASSVQEFKFEREMMRLSAIAEVGAMLVEFSTTFESFRAFSLAQVPLYAATLLRSLLPADDDNMVSRVAVHVCAALRSLMSRRRRADYSCCQERVSLGVSLEIFANHLQHKRVHTGCITDAGWDLVCRLARILALSLNIEHTRDCPCLVSQL
jgi:hypothetical protein